MELSSEVTRRGMLPLHELYVQSGQGKIAAPLFMRLLLGRIAQIEADKLDDGDPERLRMLDVVAETEDWFQDRMRDGRSYP